LKDSDPSVSDTTEPEPTDTLPLVGSSMFLFQFFFANLEKKNQKWNERQSDFMGLLAFALCSLTSGHTKLDFFFLLSPERQPIHKKFGNFSDNCLIACLLPLSHFTDANTKCTLQRNKFEETKNRNSQGKNY
jgi:hypothetical protein